jgi:hypothetical protein
MLIHRLTKESRQLRWGVSLLILSRNYILIGKNYYSLSPIILFNNIDVSKYILVIDTSVLAKSNMGRRKYHIYYGTKILGLSNNKSKCWPCHRAPTVPYVWERNKVSLSMISFLVELCHINMSSCVFPVYDLFPSLKSYAYMTHLTQNSFYKKI